MSMFADDGKIVGATSPANDRDAMHRDLQAVDDWSVQNNMPLCMNKSACLHYGNNNVNANHVNNDEPLKVTECCADLGILWASDFRYKDHIYQICLKANRLSGMVVKLLS